MNKENAACAYTWTHKIISQSEIKMESLSLVIWMEDLKGAGLHE